MRIFGIDPGFDRLGIACIDKDEKGKETLVFSECFETNKKEIFSKRLLSVGIRVRECIEKYKPDILGIEKLYMSLNQKTVMNVSEAKGVIIYEAQRNNLEIFEFTPMEIKVAITGYGHATKTDISKMTSKLIALPKRKMRDDEIDAIAVALTLSATIKHRSL